MAWRRELGKHITEVRFLVNPTAPSSAGARQVWEENLTAVKMANPRFPFLIRDLPDNVEPYVLVKYAFNESTTIDVGDMDTSAVERELAIAVAAGASMPKSRENTPFELPSIVE